MIFVQNVGARRNLRFVSSVAGRGTDQYCTELYHVGLFF